ncbi:hypothetical protein NLJ89_g833 [Agrocybe chaxingu]|uniref:NADH dehydrogenase [ubiquinone] 1 beta subcomplex subunit 7 n=1 Tax=Agrocybe chaxingu TaxID=84603 RepID=A0A9W8N188_9AGAR|nr:hypothetical protein NLJ89_g833 [Agrocybe chaxingu]
MLLRSTSLFSNNWLTWFSLLIPLNVCRKQNNYKIWECEHERHTYEKCQYDDYVRRMKELSKKKLAAAQESE